VYILCLRYQLGAPSIKHTHINISLAELKSVNQKHTNSNWAYKFAYRLFKLKVVSSTVLKTQPLNVFLPCICIACDRRVVRNLLNYLWSVVLNQLKLNI
jgi:hypothetical protein